MALSRLFGRSSVPLVALVLCCIGSGAIAEEGGFSTRPPGVQGPMGGFLPPPGFYGSDTLYLYHGTASKAPFRGRAQVNVDATLVVNLMQGIYVAPPQILGGNIGFSATVPVGYARLHGDLSIGRFDRSARQADFDLGDFALTPLI